MSQYMSWVGQTLADGHNMPADFSSYGVSTNIKHMPTNGTLYSHWYLYVCNVMYVWTCPGGVWLTYK